MKPRIFRMALLGLLLLVGIPAYYVNAVQEARRQTPLLVQQAWQRHGHVTLETLTPSRLHVLLAVEDPTFFLHHGVDLETPGAGMTTLSQGLVKLLYFPEGFQPGVAKIRQTLIAQYALDALVSKQEQLELMLSIAYMGRHAGSAIHGFPAAAQSYFGKELSALTDTEFESLVAMLMAPNRFVPGTPEHAERLRRIDAYLSGAYRPAGLLDVEYDGTTHGTFAEEMLMSLLRLITDAKPRTAGALALSLHAAIGSERGAWVRGAVK